MTTKKVCNQIVYLCYVNKEEYEHRSRVVEHESIKRMALHPMFVSDLELEDDFRLDHYKDSLFTFRVVFKNNGKWRYSCLGIDTNGEICQGCGVNVNKHMCKCDDECDYNVCEAGEVIGDGTEEEALKWLLQGEKNMEKLL